MQTILAERYNTKIYQIGSGRFDWGCREASVVRYSQSVLWRSSSSISSSTSNASGNRMGGIAGVSTAWPAPKKPAVAPFGSCSKPVLKSVHQRPYDKLAFANRVGVQNFILFSSQHWWHRIRTVHVQDKRSIRTNGKKRLRDERKNASPKRVKKFLILQNYFTFLAWRFAVIGFSVRDVAFSIFDFIGVGGFASNLYEPHEIKILCEGCI